MTTPTAQASQIPDWWNLQYFGHSVCNSDLCKPDADIDGDGLTNYQEYYYHTNPLDPHTVKDSLSDGELVAQGFDPSRTGRVTFDDAKSEDTALGDGLLFDTDIQKMVQQTQDLSQVIVPTPDDTDLKITQDDSSAAFQKYFSDVQNLTDKYFPQSSMADVENILKSGGSQADAIKNKLSLYAEELKSVTVPEKFLNYHKDTIAFYQLLGDVAIGSDASDSQSPQWYDEAQQFFVVQQRLEAESNALSSEFPQ